MSVPVVRWSEGGSLELPKIVRVLRAGGLIVYPTETVYGLGTSLSAGDDGVERVRRAKSAPEGRPYLLLAADSDAAFSLWSEVPPGARDLAERAWPGPLTLVGPARPGLPESLLAHATCEGVSMDTVSVRVPGDSRLLQLVAALGEPLLSTSANPAGQAAPSSFDAVELEQLAPDLAVDGGPCTEGRPSTLVSVVGPRPALLRSGAWPFDEAQT